MRFSLQRVALRFLSPDDVPDWLQDLTAVSEEEKLETPEVPKAINVEAPTQPAPRTS